MRIPNRIKNYVLWAAIAGLIGMALLDAGIVKNLTRFNEYVEYLLYIAVLAGIINNPSNGTGFKDK